MTYDGALSDMGWTYSGNFSVKEDNPAVPVTRYNRLGYMFYPMVLFRYKFFEIVDGNSGYNKSNQT